MRTMTDVLSTFHLQILGIHFHPISPSIRASPCQAAQGRFDICPPQVPSAQPMSAQPGTFPWEQAIDLLPGFPHPCYQWVGDLGHRALGRGPPGRLVVTGRKLKPKEAGAVERLPLPPDLTGVSTPPPPLLSWAPSVADLRLCPRQVQGHPPIAEAAGIGIEGRGALGEPLLPLYRFPEKG